MRKRYRGNAGKRWGHHAAAEDHATTLDGVASKSRVDRTTVSRRVRRETGLAWRELKSRSIEKQAKQLLLETDLTVKEIAAQLQFSSPSTFSRSFQRRTGLPPSQWRLKMSTEKE